MKRHSTNRKRAPHGSPVLVKTVAAKVSKRLFEKFHKRGGSAWLRKLMKEAP
jgi:hypothetical protein